MDAFDLRRRFESRADHPNKRQKHGRREHRNEREGQHRAPVPSPHFDPESRKLFLHQEFRLLLPNFQFISVKPKIMTNITQATAEEYPNRSSSKPVV